MLSIHAREEYNDMQELKLRVGAWHGDTVKSYPVPDDWRLDVRPMRGGAKLTDDEVRHAVRHPLKSQSISTRARKARSAVLIIDDLSRPTPGERICLALMDELNKAGVTDSHIAILMGGGAHRPFTRTEMAKKIGLAGKRAGTVACHDAWAAPVECFGVTSRGTPVLVNRIAAQADFRIAISGAYPMGVCGFGGGSKMIMPGVSHVSSITWNHTTLPTGARAGKPEDSVRRLDIEEYAKMFGLDLAACAVVNADRDLCGLVVGEPIAAQRAAVSMGKRVYYSDLNPRGRYDLNIVNAYPMDADGVQLCKSTWAGYIGTGRAATLFISEFPDRYWYHGQFDGPFAAFAAQKRTCAMPRQSRKLLMEVNRFVYNPHAGTSFNPDTNLWGHRWYYENNWKRLIGKLAERFPSARARVIPTGPIQY